MEQWTALSIPVDTDFAPDSPLLLTDGSVLVAHLDLDGMQWYRFIPNQTEGYLSADWIPIARMHTRRYGQIAAVVLPTGRVFVTGGTNNPRLRTAGEVYDPVADVWTPVIGPTFGWDDSIAGVCATLLPNGTVLCAAVSSSVAALFDPALGTSGGWASASVHNTFDGAASKTLTDDSSALAVYPGGSARYVLASGWSDAGRPPFAPPRNPTTSHTPGPLLQLMAFESGPVSAATEPCIIFGSAGEYAYRLRDGSWSYQRSLPPYTDGSLPETAGRPAVLLPSGRVLVIADDAFYSVDPSADLADAVRTEESPRPDSSGMPFSANHAHLLLLPTGEVLAFSHGRIDLYTPDASDPAGRPRDVWRPTVATVDGHPVTDSIVLAMDRNHALTGQRLTGWSNAVNQANSESAATNYPIVCLRQSDAASGITVTAYCRTADFRGPGGVTLAGVGDFSATSTSFHVPPPPGTGGSGLGAGPAELTVIVNGIESLPTPVTLTYEYQLPDRPRLWNILVGSLADGVLYVLGPDHRFHPVPGPNDPNREKTLPATRTIAGVVSELAQLGALRDGEPLDESAVNAPSTSGATATGGNTTVPPILMFLLILVALALLGGAVIGVNAVLGGSYAALGVVTATGAAVGLVVGTVWARGVSNTLTRTN